MALPARAPVGALSIPYVSVNLFALAARYLGDATQWERIADINAFPGVAPDFLLTGPGTLQIPAKNANATNPTDEASVEALIGIAAA